MTARMLRSTGVETDEAAIDRFIAQEHAFISTDDNLYLEFSTPRANADESLLPAAAERAARRQVGDVDLELHQLEAATIVPQERRQPTPQAATDLALLLRAPEAEEFLALRKRRRGAAPAGAAPD